MDRHEQCVVENCSKATVTFSTLQRSSHAHRICMSVLPLQHIGVRTTIHIHIHIYCKNYIHVYVVTCTKGIVKLIVIFFTITTYLHQHDTRVRQEKITISCQSTPRYNTHYYWLSDTSTLIVIKFTIPPPTTRTKHESLTYTRR